MDYKTQSEIRRQKILANAEARLKKIRRITLDDVEKEPVEQTQDHITGQLTTENEVAVNECSTQLQTEFPNECTRESECEDRLNQLPSTSNGIEHKTIEGQQESQSSHTLCNGSLSKSDIELPSVDELNYRTSEDSQSLQNLESLLALSQKSKKHPAYCDIMIFVFLGFLIRVLYFIGLSSIFQNNIMGPFLVVCLPRIILYIWHEPELPMVYSLIIFLGLPERRLKTPFKVYSCLRTAVQYLALYLFSFFVTHYIIKEVYL